MWWSRALLVLVLLALGPAGCGFHPLYGKPDAAKAAGVTADMASVRVLMIEDRLGQKVRNELVSRLNPRGEPAVPKFVLYVKMYESVGGLATSADGTATLAEMYVNGSYTLSQNGGVAVFGGAATSTVTTDFLGPRYASVAAERDAEDRAVTEIAEQITGRIAIYLNNPSAQPPLQSATPSHPVPMQRYQVLQGGLPAQQLPDSTGTGDTASPQ